MKLNFKNGRDVKVHIYVDGEYSMTVDRDFIAASGLYENCEISPQELEELEEAVGVRRAYNKAVQLLSYREHSRYELLTKLRQKGYGGQAEEALGRLEESGLIDDYSFAENYAAELRRTKGFGRRRIQQELFRKGVDRDIIADVTEDIETDGDELADILERKYGYCLDTQKGVTRAINGLVRMGYGFDEIRRAIETVQSRRDSE